MQTVIALAFVGLNVLILLGNLAVIGRFFAKGRLVEKLLGVAILWTAQVSFTVLVLGLAGALSLSALFGFNLLITASTILVFQGSVTDAVLDLAGSFRLAFGHLIRSRNYLLYLLLLIVGTEVAATVRKIYYLPPYVYDELNLHLVPVIVWFQEQRIPTEIDTPVTRINSVPMGAKLLHFWFVKFFRGLTWVELPQFLFSIVILLASYQLMRFLRVRRDSALAFALLIYTTPIFLIESRTCQDHITLTALFLTSLVFLVRLIQGERAYAWLLAVAGGLMIGVKVSAPLYIAAVALALVFSHRLTLGGLARTLMKRPLHSVLVLAPVVVLGSYWYVKNLLLYGSLQGLPLKPMLPDSPDPWLSAALMKNTAFVWLGTFAKNWSELFTRLCDTTSDYSADLPGISGFGIQFFAFGILGFLLTAILFLTAPHRRRVAGFLLLTAVFLQVMYFFLYYSPFSYRLFMATPALGIVLFAYVLSLARPTRRHRRVLQGLTLLMAAFSCLTTYYSERTSSLKSLSQWETLPPEDRTTISYSAVTLGVWETIDQYVPQDCAIAYIGNEDALISPYYGNRLTRRVFHFGSSPTGLSPEAERARCQAVIRDLRAKGVRLVHVSGGQAPDELRRPHRELGDHLFLLP